MIENKWKVIDRDWLKTIAIIAMTMDHIACSFLISGSAIWLIFRIIGRITFPLMAYMLADGFTYTRDLKKYIVRLLCFSVVSWFTFSFLETGSFLPIQLAEGNYTDYPFNRVYISSLDKTLCICRFSVITGLLCALLSLTVCEKTEWNLPVKILAVCGLVLITLNCDWGWINIPMVMVFYYLRKNKPAMWIVFGVLSLLYIFDFFLSSNIFAPYIIGTFKPYRIGIILVPIIIEFLYNGKKGKSGVAGQWFFYIYYPLHQVIIGILHMLFA